MTDPRPVSAFNARGLSASKVAESFIAPSHYANLLGNSHTIIVGPRGSGKTTLLKMLTREGMDAWAARVPDVAGPYVEPVEFLAAFIPTDVAWNTQLMALGPEPADPVAVQAFERGAFTVQILRALVRAIRYEVDHEGRFGTAGRTQREHVASGLAAAWELDIKAQALVAVEVELDKRLADIRTLTNQERLRNADGRAGRLAEVRFLHHDFVTLVSAALTVLEELGIDWGDWRLALCFDELELAPNTIRAELLSALRSVDERILFKLSIAPFGRDIAQLEGELSAMRDNDYNIVNLTMPHQDTDALDFSSALLLRSLGPSVAASTVEEVVGASTLESRTSYRVGTQLHQAILTLGEDETFMSWVERNGFDLAAIFDPGGDTAAPSELRKARQIIALRSAYRWTRPSAARRRKVRGRKSPDIEIFRGSRPFLLMLEGNPRFLVMTANRLRQRLENGRADPHVVREALDAATAAFRAMVRAMSGSGGSQSQAWPRGLLDFLDTVGEYFHNRIVLDDFSAEPPTTFIVDSHAPETVLDLVGTAVNAGALVYVPDEDDPALLSSLRGKRFRLTYLLSPFYGLPLKVGPSVALSTALGRDSGPDSGLSPQLFGSENEGTS